MSTTPISRITGRTLAAAPPPKPDLPAYPHHYAAPSISSQVAYKRDHWGATARALRERSPPRRRRWSLRSTRRSGRKRTGCASARCCRRTRIGGCDEHRQHESARRPRRRPQPHLPQPADRGREPAPHRRRGLGARRGVRARRGRDGPVSHAKGERIAADAVDTIATLRTQFTEAATDGEVSRQMLREFQDVRRRAEALARSLDVAERDAAWHIERCNDIYGSWLALVDKYPTLKPAIRLCPRVTRSP